MHFQQWNLIHRGSQGWMGRSHLHSLRREGSQAELFLEIPWGLVGPASDVWFSPSRREVDGPCASSHKCQTLRMARGSKTIGMKKQTFCFPYFHSDTRILISLIEVPLWPCGPWHCGRGRVVPQTLLSLRINLMPSGITFLGLCPLWSLCVLPAVTSCPF